MDQLVVLQEIYASFSKGIGSLKKIDINTIEGCCSELVARLLEDSLDGRIEEGICRKLSDNLKDVYELKRLGDICRQAGLYILAIDTYRRAISLCHDPVLSPILKNNLGQAYADQGDIGRALACYQEAALIFSREGDRISLAHVLGNLGSACRKVKNYSRAIEHAQRSLKIFEEDGDSLGIAQMTGSIGRIYADMGESELAARYFERSLADFQRLGDKRGAAWILNRLGCVARERGELDRALGYMHTSISIWEEMGENVSLGAVLADLGSTLLQMGQPSAARGALERAVLLIPEHSRSNYQRALFSLAGAYSSLAEESMREALKPDDSGTASGQEKRREAARLFARSADRYQELADTLPHKMTEIRAKAALAKSRSYLSRIYEQTPDQEALMLAEKAMAALDSAASNSNEEKKARILILKKITAGLWQAYRTDPIAHDPQEIRAALSSSAEYLMEAAGSLVPWGAAKSLRQALESIKSAIETEISGTEQERKHEAASALRQANCEYVAPKRENADAFSSMIERAAEMLEAPDRLPDRGGDGGRENDAGEEDGSQSLAWEKERAALLALAEAMMIYGLSDLENDDETPAQEDSPELPEKDLMQDDSILVEISEEDGLTQNPFGEAPARTDGPEGWGRRERDLVLADGSLEGANLQFRAREESPYKQGSWNEAGQAFQEAGCVLLPKEGQPLDGALFRAEACTEAFAGIKERLGGADRPGREVEAEAERAETIAPFIESPGQRYDGRIFREEAREAEIEDTGPQFAPAGDGLEMEPSAHPISPRVILALKILSALVLLLLLIEMMLYLI